MLKPLLFVSTAVIIGIAVLSVPGPVPAQNTAANAQKAPAKPGAASYGRAKEIYAVDCAICHGATGDGKTELAHDMELKLADWTDAKSLAGRSDHDLFNLIRNGKDKMPAEASNRAKDEDLNNLIAYIRSFSQAAPADATPTAAPTN